MGFFYYSSRCFNEKDLKWMKNLVLALEERLKMWKRNVVKEARVKGKEYIDYKGRAVPATTVGTDLQVRFVLQFRYPVSLLAICLGLS